MSMAPSVSFETYTLLIVDVNCNLIEFVFFLNFIRCINLNILVILLNTTGCNNIMYTIHISRSQILLTWNGTGIAAKARLDLISEQDILIRNI